MRLIPLTNSNKKAVIDNASFSLVQGKRWFLSRDGYATTGVRTGKKTVRFPMHTILLKSPPGKIVDHRDRNKLNNRRKNMRFATVRQNVCNASPWKKKKSSKFKGIYWNKRADKWHAQIRNNYDRLFLGHFDSEIDAAKAYNKAAQKYFVEFARLNTV